MDKRDKICLMTILTVGFVCFILMALAAVKFGESLPVTAYISCEDGSERSATVTLRAASESDPSKTATASVKLSR